MREFVPAALRDTVLCGAKVVSEINLMFDVGHDAINREALAKLFVLRIPLSGTTSFIAYLLVILHKSRCRVGSSRHGVAEGEDRRTEIR